jgi:flavin reductase (DIM6/NTAB) family NADH-FMN oxidoreductase RutF
MDRLYRINLVNSLSGFKSANLIATADDQGNENVAVFSSVIHLGSDPAVLGFVLRPTTVARNSYDNIKQTGYYTINHISKEIMEDGHHTSAKYPKGVSEFEMTNLQSEYIADFKAPFVAQAPIKMAMKFAEEYSIKLNGTILVVGEILSVYIQDDLLEEDGFVNLSKGNIVSINGLDGYTLPQLQARYPYQRPKN